MVMTGGHRQSIFHPALMCHRGAFCVHQMDYDLLDSEYHPEKERAKSSGERGREGYRRSGEVIAVGKTNVL